MPVERLKEFLDDQGVRYVSIAHSTAFTAQEIAALTHIPGREMAKTVILKLDDKMAMAVLPASRHVDVGAVKAAVGAKHAALAAEAEFRERFPDCETGAMPPFGNLYGMPVFVEEALTRDQEIAFNAGSHNEIIRLAYEDFARLVKPTIASFALERAA